MAFKSSTHILFSFISLVLILPATQHALQFINSGKLNGDVVYAADTAFTLKGWFNGSFQEKKNAYLNDNMGFRPDFVRLNNQLDWSLFNKLHLRNTLIGTNGHLYEKAYVEVYRGVNYYGEEGMKERLVKLKALQDTFQRIGKRIILVYAPSQARYYPDNFPVNMQGEEGNPNLYRTHIRISDSLNIEYLDFNGWFEGFRKHSQHLLFSKIGVHWTSYGSLVASDSMSKYLERIDNIDLPDLVIGKTVFSDDPGPHQQDIGNSMNLIFPLEKEKFSYPEYHFIQDGKVKPKIIYLGDSFLWAIMENRVPHNISKDWEFWYYFKQVLNESSLGVGGEEPPLNMEHYNWISSVSGARYIVILYTEANLWKLGDGFIDKAYEHYCSQ